MTLYIGNRPVSVNSGIIFQDTRKCGVNISNLIGDVEFEKLQQPIGDIHFKIPDGVTDLGDYALSGLFSYNNKLKSIDFSNLERISGNYACQYMCNYYPVSDLSTISNFTLNNIEISGNSACQYMFYNCTSLTSIELNNIEILGNYACKGMFNGCSKLTDLDLTTITSISGNYACQEMFKSCYGLKTIKLFNIDIVSGQYVLYDMFNGISYNTNNPIFLDLTHWTRITGDYKAYRAFAQFNPHKIDLSNLVEISGNYAAYYFLYFSNVREIDLSSLETISGNYACSGFFYYYIYPTHIDLHSLKTISGNYACSNMFYASSTKNLESIDLSSLETISGDYACQGMFYGCNKLAAISFPNLTTIEGTNPFGTSGSNLIFYNCTGLKEIHFKVDMQATIEAIPGYSTKWGATNATIYFDL